MIRSLKIKPYKNDYFVGGIILAERTKKIEVVEYNPKRKNEFKKIKTVIKEYLGDLIIRIEHVVSTYVEGLSSKPIIDIDVVIDSYDIFPEIIKRLEKKGYYIKET